MPIKESRYITIDTKIITRADVLKLARVIYSIHKRRKKEYFTIISFSVNCEGDVKFTSGDLDIFSDDSPITTKRVLEIDMIYYSSDERINIVLLHDSSSFYKSSISVKGDNSNWVNGTLKKFEEIIEGFEPQNTFIRKYGRYIAAGFLGLLTIFVSNKAIQFVTDSVLKTEEITSDMFGIIYWGQLLIVLVIMLPIVFLSIKLWVALEKMYPNVELQIGPEHKLKEKRKRLWIYAVLTVVVTPVVIEIIYEIVKSLVVK